jgi:hypothetical protein
MSEYPTLPPEATPPAHRPVDTRETLATWREDLSDRIARAQLVFELHDCGIDLSQLNEEVKAFKRCCAALAWMEAA